MSRNSQRRVQETFERYIYFLFVKVTVICVCRYNQADIYILSADLFNYSESSGLWIRRIYILSIPVSEHPGIPGTFYISIDCLFPEKLGTEE